MNAMLQPALRPVSSKRFAAVEANLKSGGEMKRLWIGQVLKEFQRTNERMGQQRTNRTNHIARPARHSTT
ncbi:MAG: hypothetical protein QM739_18945 [Propionivibrio sp.]